MIRACAIQSVLAVGVMLACVPTASAAKVPEGTIMFPDTSSIGVQCHSYLNGKVMHDLGARWVRIDLSWEGTEPKVRGEYDFTFMDKVIDEYRANGMKVMGILVYHYHCPLYPRPKENLDAAIAGFAAFSKAVAEHLKGRIDMLEIGNEPEVFAMDGVYSNPANYLKLALASAKAIREVDPNVHIGALSVAWMDRGFITSCLEGGLLKDGAIDVVTFHGYHRANVLPESGLREDIAWLRQMIRKHSSAKTKVIVADSERGYGLAPFLGPRHWSSWRNFVYTETEQAAYLARHYLEEISLGIEVSIWYKDMQGETGYSLIEFDIESRRRPMAYAMRNLATLFDTNPKQMINTAYRVNLVDLPDDNSDPNAFMKVRSYLRTYLKGENAGTERLIVAAWNPVEAFEGKILQSRQKIGEDYFDAWRSISPQDRVEIPTQVQAGVPFDRVAKAYAVNILEKDAAKVQVPVKVSACGAGITTETVKIGPVPTIVVFELKAPMTTAPAKK